jgi:hypothetical protein
MAMPSPDSRGSLANEGHFDFHCFIEANKAELGLSYQLLA